MADSPLAGCRILLVEDEAIVCFILEEMLDALGCKIVGPAARLGEALSLAAAEEVDAAVLDVNLDGEKTYPVADALIERDVPFVFSTGYDRMKNGYNALPRLQKPFHQKELAAMLEVILTRHQTSGF